MNFVFTGFLLISAICLVFYDPDLILSALLSGGSEGLQFAFKLFAIYAVWLSILNLWSKMKLDSGLGKILSPVLKKLFPGESETVYDNLSINLSANMLGMGGAGTPAGIAATENMKYKKNRIMLIVINASSVQLLPTTMIAMRSAQGGQTDIILPSLIATFVSTFTGFLMVKLFVKQ